VNQHWIIEQGILFKNISSFKNQQMVELDYMEQLLNALCTRSNKNVMLKNKEEFIKLQLKDWLERLKDSKVEAAVEDV